jgi:hypothetical protein
MSPIEKMIDFRAAFAQVGIHFRYLQHEHLMLYLQYRIDEQQSAQSNGRCAPSVPESTVGITNKWVTEHLEMPTAFSVLCFGMPLQGHENCPMAAPLKIP